MPGKLTPNNVVHDGPATQAKPVNLVKQFLAQQDTFLCTLQPSVTQDEYCPRVLGGLELQESQIDDVMIFLWADKSAMSKDQYDSLARENISLQMVKKTFRFPSDPTPTKTLTATRVCALTLKWNHRILVHTFLVIPDLLHSVYVGSDILVRLGVQVDTVNNVLWSLITVRNISYLPDIDNLKSGQTIPEACQVANAQHATIPTRTANVPLQLNATRPESQ